MPENFVVQPLWRAPGRAITSRGEDRLSALVAVLSGMFPIRMFRAAESGTLHPERRAPIGRTRMIRGVAPASLSPEVNAIRRFFPYGDVLCPLAGTLCRRRPAEPAARPRARHPLPLSKDLKAS